MMKALKCDRCHKLYDNSKHDHIANPNRFDEFNAIRILNIGYKDMLNESGYSAGRIIDLCPECSDALHRWLLDFENSEAQNDD